MTNVVLAARALSVRRGTTQILDAIDWRIEPGEHWVLLGANGSGKTSLLAALTGYLTPTAGSLELLGAVYGRSDWRALRRRVGLVSSAIRQMMPEHESALGIVLGGRDAAIGQWGRASRPEVAAAQAVLRLAEAESIGDRPWAVLSQGERQRVLIARALLPRPDLLMLDEPCAGLDPVAREHFLGTIERLAHARAHAPTLVLVTHHIEEITRAFTHALVLREGRVHAAGRCPEVLKSKVLSAAFGAPLRVRQRGGRWTLDASSGMVPP